METKRSNAARKVLARVTAAAIRRPERLCRGGDRSWVVKVL